MSDTLHHSAEEESAPSPKPQEPSKAPLAEDGGRGSGPSSWRAFRDPLLLGVLLAALVADQITKQWVLNSLGIGASWPNNGFFRFTFVRNDGTAFGLFQDNGTLLTFVSIGAVALIVYFYREAAMASWFTRVALGLQLGGALGNLVDRFRHGYVVDFIDVGPWPIFNIADSAIITGIAALIGYFTLFGGRDGKAGEEPSTDIDARPSMGPSTEQGSPSTPESRD
ncbi:MAG TPA: signal peptidase II [Dehalococcoidia bacterium]|nr:signal peptidase II [Chloroflexota bacterium]MDP7213976.1 signal peptidase II [Dehalococcoidia bacterium]HCV28461.1 signal peptidase II [Dehalococcoidia bacterium]